MGHDHSGHSHFNVKPKEIKSSKLLITILLNLAITISEILGGLFTRSLSLLSDAFHNLTDVISLIISFIAMKISAKSKNEINTFGYKRAEVLAALLNIIILFGAVFYIIKEAVKRFFNPEIVNANIMIIIAVIGFLGNLFSVIILFKDAKKNINIKSSFLHLLGDTMSSVGVIIVALVLIFFPKLYILDPIVSLLITAFIIKEAISVMNESINILMQSTPKNINLKKIIKRLTTDKKLEIINVHHLHLWGLSSEDIILDFHAVIPKKSLNKIDEKLKEVNHILACEFNILHATIQFESDDYDHSVRCEI